MDSKPTYTLKTSGNYIASYLDQVQRYGLGNDNPINNQLASNYSCPINFWGWVRADFENWHSDEYFATLIGSVLWSADGLW